MAKLMVSFRDENFRLLTFETKNRGITIQELLRAVIVPDWIRIGNVSDPHTESSQLQPMPAIRRGNQTAIALF